MDGARRVNYGANGVSVIPFALPPSFFGIMPPSTNDKVRPNSLAIPIPYPPNMIFCSDANSSVRKADL